MKNQSVIVINGRHYDAHTGKALPGQKPHARQAGHSARAGRSSTDYRPTRHLKAHRTEPARTLMRKAVHKPAPSPRRRIKVQASLHSSGGGREHSRIITHREHRSYAPHSRNHAVKTTHSRLISHFSPELFSVDGHTSLGVYGSGAVSRSAAAHRTAARHTPRKHTTDELLEFAVQHAPHAPKQHAVRHRRRIIRHPHARQHA